VLIFQPEFGDTRVAESASDFVVANPCVLAEVVVRKARQIQIDGFIDVAHHAQPPLVDIAGSIAQLRDGLQVVADIQDGFAALAKVGHAANALFLERSVADSEDLVDHHDVTFEMCGDGETESDGHAGTVSFDGRVDVFRAPREVDDLVKSTLNVTSGEVLGGSIDDVAENDNVKLRLQSPRRLGLALSFEMSGVSPASNPSAISLTFDGSVARNKDPIYQIIEVYNYASGNWEEVNNELAPMSTDGTTTVDLAGNLADYVEPGTNRVKARMTFDRVFRFAALRVKGRIDQFIWTISD